jgi:hypothetical protein
MYYPQVPQWKRIPMSAIDTSLSNTDNRNLKTDQKLQSNRSASFTVRQFNQGTTLFQFPLTFLSFTPDLYQN